MIMVFANIIFFIDSTLNKINSSQDGFLRNIALNSNGKFCLYFSEFVDYNMHRGTTYSDIYKQNLIIYNSYQNRFNTLISKKSYLQDKMNNQFPIQKLYLSQFGNLSALQYENLLYIYNNITCNTISKLKINDNSTSLVFTDDNQYLIGASKKNLFKYRVNSLQTTDSIAIPELTDKIESLAFSSNQTGVYFISGKEIYKTNTDLNSNELIASYFVDFDVNVIGKSVNFINTSSGNPLQYLWEFGDGTTSTEQNPSHIYDLPGYYDVKLKIYKNDLYDDLEIKKSCKNITEIEK